MVSDRRTVLGGVAMLGLATVGASPSMAQPVSLKAAADARGLKFGTAMGGEGFANADYRALTARECGVLTAENAMKWMALRPDTVRFDFREFDRMVGWARREKLELRGHTLLWPRQERLPGWLREHDFGRRPAEEVELIVDRHVATVAQRYAARIPSFDVVNEAVDPATGDLRHSVLSDAAGGLEPLMDLAFHTTRQAAPKAQLVYNDYMDWGEWSSRHRAGVLRLLEGFRARGVPVDALGIQGHVNASAEPGVAVRREGDWRAFLDEATGMGYRLLVTEFDAEDRDLTGDEAARDAQIAAYAEAYAGILLSYPQTDAFVTWGLSDRYSWLHEYRPRSDGLRKRGCLYDEALRPKPVREALLRAFAAAPPRA